MRRAVNEKKGTSRVAAQRMFLFRWLIMPARQAIGFAAVWLALGVLSACTPATRLEVAVKISPPAVAALATATVPPRPAGTATATPAPKCGLTELLSGQTISSSCSFTQTETEAAGPMICRIQRNSCAFKNLITDRDPDIVFSQHKPQPLTDEDATMHPAMLLPLTRLSGLVRAEWGSDVKLMVTAAYDSTLEHDPLQTDPTRKYSLHFEGRSIDLVTYPSDPAKLPKLCALALTAGFDWVHNEDDHCHASVNTSSLCSLCSGSAP